MKPITSSRIAGTVGAAIALFITLALLLTGKLVPHNHVVAISYAVNVVAVAVGFMVSIWYSEPK
jgi:hypothetical protein